MKYFLITILVLITSVISAETVNGFDLSNAIIDKEAIHSGGPPRDGIPSIDSPVFISPDSADFLKDSDIVIGLNVNGDIKAYPTRILVWHEMVNDIIGDKPVVVSYCPLCGTAMVFERVIDSDTLDFGVSGLLYNSDVLMYDRQNESLWSQIMMKAVSGPLAGTELTWLSSQQMTWKAWKDKYPRTEVLSTETGYERDYERDAYASYFKSDKTMFPVPENRDELGTKDAVAGIIVNETPKAYPLDQLPSGKTVTDTLSGETITFKYNETDKYIEFRNREGEIIPSVTAFWFAWQAFYPETELWQK